MLQITNAILVAIALTGTPLMTITERYVEGRRIEALVNADNSSGTINVRPLNCSACNTESYPFDETLRVIRNGEDQPLEVLARWHHFTGDVVFSKQDDRVVAVIYRVY